MFTNKCDNARWLQIQYIIVEISLEYNNTMGQGHLLEEHQF